MRKFRHALQGATYELTDLGHIRVEKDGKEGYFTKEGVYLRGEITFADPHLCGWIGGPQLPSRHAQAIKEAQDKAAAAANG